MALLWPCFCVIKGILWSILCHFTARTIILTSHKYWILLYSVTGFLTGLGILSLARLPVSPLPHINCINYYLSYSFPRLMPCGLVMGCL